MAKKKKKGSRGSQEIPRTIGFKKSIVLCKLASEKVVIPDFPVHFKRKAGASGQAFVNESCIQRFETLKEVDNKVTMAVSRPAVSRKKLRNRKMVEFVPSSCITDRVSRGYQGAIPAGKAKVAVVLDYTGNTVRKRFLKKDLFTSFVPQSCITPAVSQAYKPVIEPLSQKYFNPCPELPALAPDIIGGMKKTKQRRISVHTSFASGDCINASVSIPYSSPEEKLVIKYIYVERPNSPDILGPPPRKKRRKSGEVIPFVAKSCTIENKVIPEHRAAISQTESLALTEPEDQPNSRINGWYLSAILFVLLVILAYFLEK